ncbi:MAG: MFS transporter [Oligoflexales bacterium]
MSLSEGTKNCDGLKHQEQLGLYAAIASLSYVFWVVGAMEMVERLAFYGVKTVAALYAKDPVSEGGLGVSLSEFGNILMVWALIQSILPVFTGGLSDRYGYKETIFCSTIVKIMGYLVMAWYPSYYGFFAGAILLAAGTAIFKPGIQGTLVKATNLQNSSVAWGIFYQTVNIGGFLGPLVAGLLRKMEWSYVFYACAGLISLNFILLLCYTEVGKEERLQRLSTDVDQKSLWQESIHELSKPHVWSYLAVFSGFWFMFNALFDVLPVHIDEWVNTEDIVRTFFPSGASENPWINFFVVMDETGTSIQPEGMLNFNAGMIMLTCFIVAYFSGHMRATTSMVIGTLLSVCALLVFGSTNTGWACLLGIAIFSFGEMLSSPKFSEFMGNFAPQDKKAMYLGFSQIPLAIGWTLEGKLGPMLYDHYSSKERFSRELIEEKFTNGHLSGFSSENISFLSESLNQDPALLTGMLQKTPEEMVALIPQGEGFEWLVALTGEAANDLTHQLYMSHNIGFVWYIMAVVGAISAMGIAAYGRWLKILLEAPKAS